MAKAPAAGTRVTGSARLFIRKSVAQMHAEHAKSELKRSLNAFNLISLGIGCIIGTGIFVLTGRAAADFAGPGIMISSVITGALCAFVAATKLLKSLKRPTIDSTFHQLSAFLEHFVERGVLAQNPIQRPGKLKEFPDPVPDYLNEDERRQLIEFCERGRTPYVRQRDRLLFTLKMRGATSTSDLAQQLASAFRACASTSNACGNPVWCNSRIAVGGSDVPRASCR